MKAYFLLAILILSGFIGLCQEKEQTRQIPDNSLLAAASKKAGLVAYLTSIKAISEAKIIALSSIQSLTDPKNSRAPIFISRYNLTKMAVDKLINQLSADLYSKNFLRLYRRLNAYIKSGKELPSKFSVYKDFVDDIDGIHESLMISTYGGKLGGAGLEEITGVFEQVSGAVIAARDFREKKIQSIVGLLKELRIQKISDLLEPKKG